MYDRQPPLRSGDDAMKFLIYFGLTTSFLIGAFAGSYFSFLWH